MRHETKWITLWIFSSSTMAILGLIYLYLNHEFTTHYATSIFIAWGIFSIVSYSICKYTEYHSIQKDAIIIQFLNDKHLSR